MVDQMSNFYTTVCVWNNYAELFEKWKSHVLFINLQEIRNGIGNLGYIYFGRKRNFVTEKCLNLRRSPSVIEIFHDVLYFFHI